MKKLYVSARTSREGWASEIAVALQRRDDDTFHLIHLCLIVNTRQVKRYRFGARSTASDRLRKLYCAGYLECFVAGLERDNYYALSARGRDRLSEVFDIDPATVRLVKKLPAKLDHLTAVNDMRLHVLLACRTSTTYVLDSFQSDADLAAERHAALLDLIPDAKVVLRSTGEVHAFMVEVDLGTEAVTWLVRHKLAVYARHAQIGNALYGLRDPLVVLVVPGLRRAKNIARTMTTMRVNVRVVFALAPLLDESNILAAAYALPTDLLAASPDAQADAIFTRRLLP